MARTASGNDGDFGFRGGIGTTVDDLVLRVECQGWVGEGEGVEGGLDELVGVGKEVFRCFAWLLAYEYFTALFFSHFSPFLILFFFFFAIPTEFTRYESKKREPVSM